ncbi:MAG: outer membrane beta-barrel protein [Verrucomicrobia bacterium]|nr:outer membrane beta-barrel protein [Verrucomicrobiota bacterium]
MLLEQKHRWLLVTADNQLSFSNNPLLLEDQTNSASLNAFSLGMQVVFPARVVGGGAFVLRAGLTSAWYNYGLVTGRQQDFSGSPIKLNDFEALTPQIEASWQRGNWFIFGGLRYNRLTQGGIARSVNEFYSDLNPTLLVSRRFGIAERTDLWLQIQTDWRRSSTESFGLLPSDWNDRWSQSVSLTVNHFVGSSWLLQGRYAYQYSDYLVSGRSRTDHLHTVVISATHTLNRYLLVRPYLSYEQRNSSEEFTTDYRKIDLGISITFNREF